ncbi:permease [Alkaliphilus pronyensis]|uniref:Permease n=1 Tax=Alkaliphilus pronyensis TaxID=1482732 RepID=A0A6I0EYM5_9FIRM|nr:permease [Alkaliphilus pronyensis]KAB3530667.1 permease [Alkaliphilus pronyensis]
MVNYILEFKQLIPIVWLNVIISHLIRLFKTETVTKIGESINYTLNEFIKMIILLFVIIFVISFIQSYFPPERTKRILYRYKGFMANIIGATLGIISPFCSCSSIPLFIGLNKAGTPIGATFSFLIASPLLDMASLLFLISLFGFSIGIAYVLVGIFLAVIGGVIIERLKLSKEIKILTNQNDRSSCDEVNEDLMQVSDRIIYAKKETIYLLKSIWKYILISIAIATIIKSWIPQGWILGVLGENNPLSVLIATLIGVPLYTDEMSAIVIGKAFASQGVQVGTVLSFMMSAAALSLPSMIMLRSVLSKKLLAIFISIVTIGIIIIGCMFNLVQTYF